MDLLLRFFLWILYRRMYCSLNHPNQCPSLPTWYLAATDVRLVIQESILLRTLLTLIYIERSQLRSSVICH